ncbi:MAG TPA: trypsin-like peptidase domain-containing protein [Symbiobacteriaceae bacterium]|nr:trypsin-like peptidase domain-containing protein [Symbiobacteriaceae bacterium]
MLNDKEHPAYEHGQHNEQPSAEQSPAVQEAQPVVAPQDPVMQLPEIPVAAAPAEPLMYEAPPAPRKSGNGLKLFAAALALVAMGAAAGGVTAWAVASNYVKSSTPIGYTANASSSLKAIAQTNTEVAASVIPGIWQRVSPSVVKIEVESKRGSLRGSGLGSGFVVDPKGYIMTNHHVIAGATSIKVKFVDGTVLDGKVMGSDQYKDVAIVKVDPGNRPLTAVAMGNSEATQVGELAVAIGSPFGQEFTVTAGIVSAVNRTLNESPNENPIFAIPGGIQTDAAINPGNSGGPLLNANGEVIGINTLIDTGNSGVEGNLGIGFAVPINLAKELMPTLIEGKQVGYAYLGVEPMDLTAAIAKQIGVDVKEGIVVNTVSAGSAAEKAGLQEPTRLGRQIAADVITAMDGKPIKNANDLYTFIASKKPGDTIKITVLRGKETVELTATLGTRPIDE